MPRKDNPRRANGTRRTSLMTRMLSATTTCWLCGGEVDPMLRGAYVTNPRTGRRALHPMAPVLDEVIPVSLGGDPLDWDNVALAHSSCNGYRGARMDVDSVRAELTLLRSRKSRTQPRQSQSW